MAMHFAVAMGHLQQGKKTFSRKISVTSIRERFYVMLRTPMERNTKTNRLHCMRQKEDISSYEPVRKEEIPAKSKNNGHELVLIFLKK